MWRLINLIHAASRVFNWFRLRGLPEHQRRVRQARRVLTKLRTIRGVAAEARLFAYLRKIDPLVFEELVLCAFEEAGAFVVRNLRYSGDGGIDGRVWIPGGGWHALQAKRYGAHINHGHITAFGAALARSGHHRGCFVHCGRTGSAAHHHLKDRRIILISGDRLLALVCSRRLPPPHSNDNGSAAPPARK